MSKESKPFAVWPSDREHPYRFASYQHAECYAKKSALRTGDGVTIASGFPGTTYANVSLKPSGGFAIDMTDAGSAFA